LADRLQDSFFRALFHTPVLGIAVADLKSECIVETNQRLLQILGRGRDEVEGIAAVWRDITPPEHHHLDEAALRQVLERGYSDPFEKEYQRPDGSRVPVRVSATVVPQHPDYLIVLVDDISAEKAGRERELNIQRRLEIALSAADQGVWDWDLTTNAMVYSDRAKQIYGFAPDEPVSYERVRDATHPDDLPISSALLKRAIDPELRDRSSYEYRVLLPDGSSRWVLAFGEAVFEGPPGQERAVRYAGTIQDISERKASERHQELLIAELNHRVKNTLAIVQALAFQTLRRGEVPDSVGESFAGRLQALAAAHDILVKEGWESASIEEVASAVLDPHDGGEGRISVEGKPIRLPPQMTVTLAMTLHELATNAVKHGALSNGHGRVRLSWEKPEAEPRIRLSWVEEMGPPVREPERQGFGTRMIRRAFGAEANGTVALDFSPTGLRCEIEARLA
jgi:PAS domain S-box-containing protein